MISNSFLWILSIMVVCVALVPFVSAQDTNQPAAQPEASPPGTMPTDLTATDKAFLQKAALSARAETEIARMAEWRSNDPAVQKFSDGIVGYHAGAFIELQEIASTDRVVLPVAIDERDDAPVRHLSTLTGSQFDSPYVSLMVRDLSDDVDAFQRESSIGTDSVLKDFAAKMLPTLQRELNEAQQLASGAVSRR